MQEAQKKLITDFPFYTKNVLKIKTKSKGLIPMVLNNPQLILHEVAERQRKEFGYVRIIILKARQHGISTYIAARFYAETTRRKGINALVMAHDTYTTNLLFAMVQIFHDECPEEMKEPTNKESAKEFEFSNLKSNYRVATAGSATGGRGGTVQDFHGSEVAFWGDAEGLITGIMQSIPSGLDIEGSEVFLESTANGESGLFFELWQAAEKAIAKGEVPAYIPVFLPWWLMYSYRVVLPEKYELYEDEIEYRNTYGLDDAQMLWRRGKMQGEFITNPDKFKQEYPATAQEAFETSIPNTFFKRDFIQQARYEKKIMIKSGARVGACDPGGDGEYSDKTAIGHGDDLAIDNIEYHHRLDPSQIAELTIAYINKYDLAVMWIDVIGIGSGVYSICKEKGYLHIIRPFIASAGTTDVFTDPMTGKVTALYENKRAEAHGRLRKWIGTGEFIQIPENQQLYEDMLKPIEFRHPKKNTIMVESKLDMKKRKVKSPNGLDVLMMIKCEFVPERLNNRAKCGVIDLTENYDPLTYGLYD